MKAIVKNNHLEYSVLGGKIDLDFPKKKEY